jgi:hypothetical protein
LQPLRSERHRHLDEGPFSHPFVIRITRHRAERSERRLNSFGMRRSVNCPDQTPMPLLFCSRRPASVEHRSRPAARHRCRRTRCVALPAPRP